MYLTRPPLAIIFKPHRDFGTRLPNLGANEVPVKPYTTPRGFRVRVGHRLFTVKRTQQAFLPAYALTFFKCQGQNVKYTILDPTMPAKGMGGAKLALENIYVGCSRSSGRETIRLLRRMGDSVAALLQKHVAEYVRNDDSRTRQLAVQTRSAYEAGDFSNTKSSPTKRLVSDVYGTNAVS